ncbi:MAG: hypothetical protein KatS3mg110_4061 [Pirellulaceae bacterium]|nr:MAG: hypothetical protein KatS3mg110_4061 [Pirellulaceae bacterium]
MSARISVGLLLGVAALLAGMGLVIAGFATSVDSKWQESALAAGIFQRCPDDPNSVCPACVPYASCTLTAGGFCKGMGGADGCRYDWQRRRCEWAFYWWCSNNVLTCGQPMTPSCNRVYEGDIVVGCQVGPCVPGGNADCWGC